MSEVRKGTLFGIVAYACWGLFPLFWLHLRTAGALELIAHRAAWSLVVMVLLMANLKGFGWLRAIEARRLGLLGLAAALTATEWLIYVWAANNGHVVEAALGYFINPLLSVVLGVVFLGERMRRAQWMALAFAAAAVVVLTIDYGRPPWVAIFLALSFGLYGFVKKKVGLGALQGLTVETGLLFLPALGYLLFLNHGGAGMFGHLSHGKDLLLASCGLVTVVPLLSFSAAANRVPLRTIGLLQYIQPSTQFFCGVVILHEAMPTSRWMGFALVWLSLAIYGLESVLRRRRDLGHTTIPRDALSSWSPAAPTS